MTTSNKESKPVWAIGLMSGTSLDGVDAALLKTDGTHIFEFGESLTLPYDEHMRARLFELTQRGENWLDKAKLLATEDLLTRYHADATNALLEKSAMKPDDIALVGFHGQTLIHLPEAGQTWQIGNPALLAKLTGINVIADFRRNDMAHGGQGAPLVPIFHHAMANTLEKPVAIVNIGGVANVSWIGAGDALEENIMAFDTGPGNGLIDEWVKQHSSQSYDENGAIARKGKPNKSAVEHYMSDTFFKEAPPKSLDRNQFTLDGVKDMSLEEGAATLTEVSIQSIAVAEDHFPQSVKQWVICGGGRHNNAIMRGLKIAIKSPVIKAENVNWQGDALEAQAFAFLAVRSKYGMVLTLAQTTAVAQAVTGGVFYPASTSCAG